MTSIEIDNEYLLPSFELLSEEAVGMPLETPIDPSTQHSPDDNQSAGFRHPAGLNTPDPDELIEN